MPNEQIVNFDRFAEGELSPGFSSKLQVAWSKTTETFPGSVTVFVSIDKEHIKNLYKDVESGDVDSFHTWVPDLTREEINKFIRVLRRARDQAFGQDA